MENTGLIKINIDGKPFEKLIQVVSDGIGTLYRPRKIRKEADAQAYAIRVLEKAKADAGAEAAIIEAETADRIGQRIVAKESRRQDNIDTIVEMAAHNLEGKEVSDKPVDEDWATRYFNIVQDISKDEMRILWAKILANEIQRPSSFSLRTIELLRNLSTEEAELFVKFSDLVFVQEGYSFAFNGDQGVKKYGFNYYYVAKLMEAGLLQSGEMVRKTFPASKTATHTYSFVCGNKFISIIILPDTRIIELPVLLLSRAGCELYELTDHKDNMGYLKDFAAFIKQTNPTASVKVGNILERDGLSVKYTTPLNDL